MIIVMRVFLVTASGSDANIKLKLGSNQGREIPDR